MKKMKMESIDGISRNIELIGKLFPNVITEVKNNRGGYSKAIDFEKLKEVLSNDIEEKKEKYEFTWPGKMQALAESQYPIRKTLRPCIEESINWDTTENLYIEGDNLEVLKLLQESYLNRVKMIYIDPPYNTGHDFIYPDSYKMDNAKYGDETGYFDENGNINYSRENGDYAGKYHSDWCSMIYARLLLARNLLSDDGFIAISIGEEESYNLRKICNEIFGEANFRNIISVRRYDKNLNLQFVSKGLATMNVGLEYILIYSKNSATKMNAVYKPSNDDRSESGYWKGFWNNADRPTMRYPLLGVMPNEGQWKWKKEVAEEAVRNYAEYDQNHSNKMTLEEYWRQTGKSKKFIRRNYSGVGKNQGVEHWVAPADGILRNSNWSDLLVSKPIGLDIQFDNPKNINVIIELIKLFGVDDNDIVLDFFAGSSSTAHAVMELNAKDGKFRKFIMVQLPYPCSEKSESFKSGFSNICEIGKERIRRASKSIHESKQHNPFDDGFRVLKLDSSNMNEIYYRPQEYFQDLISMSEKNVKSDRTDLDLLFGCLLEWGLELSKPCRSELIQDNWVHSYNQNDLIACFSENIPEEVVRSIAKRKPLRAVFRDGSFQSDADRINLEEIFKLISPETEVRVL